MLYITNLNTVYGRMIYIMKFVSQLTTDEIRQRLNETTHSIEEAVEDDMLSYWSSKSDNVFYLSQRVSLQFGGRDWYGNYRTFRGKIKPQSNGSIIVGNFFDPQVYRYMIFLCGPILLNIVLFLQLGLQLYYEYFDTILIITISIVLFGCIYVRLSRNSKRKWESFEHYYSRLLDKSNLSAVRNTVIEFIEANLLK